MKRRTWHCRACDKTAFPSESSAEKAIDRIQSSGHARRTSPRRAYPCPYNPGAWHLTKQQEKEKA